MPKYLIERDISGAGTFSQDDLQQIVTTSCEVVQNMEKDYIWHHSYVTNDKFYCVHEADNEEMIREHAKRGGFPVTKITEIKTVIGPNMG